MPHRVPTCLLPLLLAGPCALVAPSHALAHHAPGHGASESIRTLNTFAGRTPRAMQRALLLGEVTRTTAEPNRNAATVSTLSAMLSLQPHQWLSVGAQVPWTLVHEEAEGVGPKTGLGDTRFELRLTPPPDQLVQRVLTFGLNLSIPTRTVRFQVDPGPLWNVAPLVAFARSYEGWSWQTILLAPVEHRPAGTAFEASWALAFSYRPMSAWSIAAGPLVDVRVASLCTQPGGGSTWCREGRVTEQNRDAGTTRAYVTAGTGLDFAEDWTVSLSVQVPLTERRDFDLAGSAGLEARF